MKTNQTPSEIVAPQAAAKTIKEQLKEPIKVEHPWIALGFILLVAGLLALQMFGPPRGSSTPPRNPDTAEMAFYSSQSILEKQLPMGARIVFAGLDQSTVSRDGRGWVVVSQVSAPNSFGAMVESPYVMYLYHEGSDRWKATALYLNGQQLF